MTFPPALQAAASGELFRALSSEVPAGAAREAELALVEVDARQLISELDAAVACAAPELFARHVSWLAGMRQSRGQPRTHLNESVRALIPFFQRHLPGGDAAPIVAVLRSAASTPPPVEPRSPLPAELAAYVAAALGGNAAEATRLFEVAARATSYADAAVGLVQPALRELGRLWEQNEVSVAQEHLATAITQRVLAQGSMRASYLGANGRRALLACVEGNHHSLGLRIVADTLETGGWETRFLGADVPTGDLLSFASDLRPDLIGLSLSLPEQLLPTRDVIRELRTRLGPGCPPIWAGGLVTTRAADVWRKVGADGWANDALGRLAPP